MAANDTAAAEPPIRITGNTGKTFDLAGCPESQVRATVAP